MLPFVGQSIRRRLIFAATCILISINMDAYAQGEEGACPCFSQEEVESIFRNGAQLNVGEGKLNCSTENYSVECHAEVIVWDANYATIAQARVDWFDYDPGNCSYIDNIGNPVVERNVSWPHPAPEDTARACFGIIAKVIEQSDRAGACSTFP